jgi:hypothetical protein
VWEGVSCVPSKEKRRLMWCAGGVCVCREEERTCEYCICAAFDGRTGGGMREAEGAGVQRQRRWVFHFVTTLASCLGFLFVRRDVLVREEKGKCLHFACAGRELRSCASVMEGVSGRVVYRDEPPDVGAVRNGNFRNFAPRCGTCSHFSGGR